MEGQERLYKHVHIRSHAAKEDSSKKKQGKVTGAAPKDASRVREAALTAPLTTAELALPTFQYFSERIEFKGVYRSELWPRHKIVAIGLTCLGSHD